MSSGAQPERISGSQLRMSPGGLLDRYTASSVSGPQQTVSGPQQSVSGAQPTPPSPFTLNIHMTAPP
jgi:hypothetical protein